ncbi:rod shape-determining protein [Dactylosporangium aurantiacum]|uniref:Rod shape-determining protein n=1 Tax=Dactylosporangium aurantiacum TaxID=35754 RepID=A0A9Q9I951_9ACTN|nr:rod shape-determining protein [Dactylosporangium aurantiacum]MDG6106965.1 rod shape-determining protein [Dactylosporangium aurantiacum]UWZ50676.1 rod shape-determining protein [Dactylosporangium aurantiacum]
MFTQPSVDTVSHGPSAVGLDLGGASIRVWASGHGMLQLGYPATPPAAGPGPVVRGRITDPAAMWALLSGLRAGRRRPLPGGAIVVACRPVGSDTSVESAVRGVVTTVFEPERLLFIDTVRAAAIGAGATSSPLLIADIGAHLTEVAVLADGLTVAARRRDVGLHDAGGPDPDAAVVAAVADLVRQVCRQAGDRQAVAAAVRGGLLLVGGGASRPRLAARIAGTAGTPVRRPAAPHLAAARGAGLAALAALRRGAMRP